MTMTFTPAPGARGDAPVTFAPTQVEVPAAVPALDLIIKRISFLKDRLSVYSGELDRVAEAVFGPVLEDTRPQKGSESIGKIGAITFEMDDLEHVIGDIEAVTDRLRALA